jgi:hypothetical protein
MSPVFMLFQPVFVAYHPDATDLAGKVSTVANSKAWLPSHPFSAA